MDNSSTYWNRISGWFESLGLPYITQAEAILILLSALFVLLILLWIIFRRARLWYWKTNVQLDTLKSIDSHLKNVEEKLSSDAIKLVELQKEQIQSGTAEEPVPEPVQEKQREEGLTAKGKSGRVYTEAELELQIRE